MKIIFLLLIIAILILAGFFIYGFYLNIKASNLCEKECNAIGGIGYETIPNNKLNIHDLCICYYKDSLKTWKIK